MAIDWDEMGGLAGGFVWAVSFMWWSGFPASVDPPVLFGIYADDFFDAGGVLGGDPG